MAIRKTGYIILTQSNRIIETERKEVIQYLFVLLCAYSAWEVFFTVKVALSELIQVYTYVSQFSKSDHVLNTNHDLSIKLQDIKTTKDAHFHVVSGIEEKLSIGLIEKRTESLKEEQKRHSTKYDKFLEMNFLTDREELIKSIARIFYQIRTY